MVFTPQTESILKALGERLRKERLRRNESQRVFAARIGSSIPTLKKMESGDPRVLLGYWVCALDILGRQEDLLKILSPPEDLFEKYALSKQPERRRARKHAVPD